MAEVEFGGMKFKGGKIFVILTLLSTLAGGLWAGFEFYKDYMDMRDKIETYTAPDLSDYDKRIELAKQNGIEIEAKRWADMGHVEGIWGHTEEFEKILVAFFSKNLG